MTTRTFIAWRLCVMLALAALASCETTYGFEPIEVGSDEASSPRPRSNSQFVRAVFADVLGRSPEVYDFTVTDADDNLVNSFPLNEADDLVTAMDSVGDPRVVRALIATGLVSSKEAALPDKAAVADPQAFIADQFRRLLGREPGAYELEAFLREWQQSPDVGPREVVRAIVGSREYQSY
jgi:hypothetical protein